MTVLARLGMDGLRARLAAAFGRGAPAGEAVPVRDWVPLCLGLILIRRNLGQTSAIPRSRRPPLRQHGDALCRSEGRATAHQLSEVRHA